MAFRQKNGSVDEIYTLIANAGELDKLAKTASSDQKLAIDYFKRTASGKAGCLSKMSFISDGAYDEVVMKRLNEYGAKARALKKIGMDESQVNEIAPVRFYGFEDYDNKVGKAYAERFGEDGRWRSSIYSSTWLFFSDEQILMYYICFDLLSDAKKERTEEYFYTDITNFSSRTRTKQDVDLSMTKGCFGKMKENAEKKITDFNSFTLTVPGSEFSCSVTGVPDVERTIQGIKQKLREKKMK